MRRSIVMAVRGEGAGEVHRMLDGIADSGDASAKRLARSYQKASDDVGAAIERQERAAARISAIMPQTAMQMRVDDANGSGFSQWEGSARKSAFAMRELLAEQERLERQARSLVLAMDPVAAAQDRMNREVGEAQKLVGAGLISLDQYVAKLGQEQAALDRVTEAVTRRHSAEKGVRYDGISAARVSTLAGVDVDPGRSAQESASVFSSAFDKMEARAKALMLAIDPAAAALDRFNREIAEAQDLVGAGVLTLDQYVAKLNHERSALDAVTESLRRRSAAEQGVRYGGVDRGRVDEVVGGVTTTGRSAQESASVFTAAYDRMESRARALMAAIDPVAVAQDRFNREIGEARDLVSQGALSLDDYARKLVHSRGELDAATAAQQRGGTSLGALRMASMGASYQVQDFLTQVSMGQNPVNAFAVNAAQLAGQFAHVEGKAGMAARFFMGPWGLAITGAIMLGSMFTKDLFKQGESLDDLVDKLKADAEETQRSARAKEAYRGSIEGLQEAISEQNESLRESINLGKTAAEQAYEGARANVRLAESLAAATRARLEDQRALLQAEMRRASGPGEANERAALNLPGIADQIAETEAGLQRIEGVEERLRNQLRAFGVDVAIEHGQRANDAVAQINRRYDGEIDAVRRRGQEQARAGQNAAKWVAAETAAIEKRRQTALKEEQERQQKGRTPTLGAQLSTERSQQLLTSAQKYVGLNEHRAGDRSTLRALFSEANETIDPKITAWCAAFVNAVLATNGLPGTDSLAARSFLNYGTATNKPEMGDIVVLRRGNNQAQGHVGFYAGEGANGKIMVTGGNQGDAVSTAGFNRRDVLGFRRAPTDAASFKSEEKQAAERERELARLTAQYDPLTAAATRYREEVDKVNLALKRGDIDESTAEQYRAGAKRTHDMEVARITGADTAVQNALRIMDQLRQAERQREKAVADNVARMLGSQQESLAIAHEELRLGSAGDQVREASIAKLRLILDLKRDGIAVDSANGRQLIDNHDALEAIYQQLERQRTAWEEVRSFGESFVTTVLSPDTWRDWGEGGKRVLDMLRGELLKLALLNPIRNWMNGDDRLPTVTNLLGRLGGLFGGGGATPPPAMPTTGDWFGPGFMAPRAAAGTHHSSGGAMLLGEFGPELAWLPRGSQVSTANDTRRMFAANDRAPREMRLRVEASPYFNVAVEEVAAPMMSNAMVQGAAGGAQIAEAESAASASRRLGSGRWG